MLLKIGLKPFKKWLLLILLFSFNFAYTTPELGLFIGWPTGISLEYNDFQGVAGINLHDYFQLQIDYLFFYKDIVEKKDPLLKFYVGAGGVLKLPSDNSKKDNSNVYFGIRVPLGIFYIVKDIPLKIFIEFGPALYLVEEVKLDIGGGIGVRYVF